MNAQNETLILLSTTVDRLAVIKARMAELELEEKTLRQTLIDSGLDAIDGTLHRASVSHSTGRVVVDWRTIAEHFNPSHQLITAHTSIGAPFYTVRVSARKGA